MVIDHDIIAMPDLHGRVRSECPAGAIQDGGEGRSGHGHSVGVDYRYAVTGHHCRAEERLRTLAPGQDTGDKDESVGTQQPKRHDGPGTSIEWSEPSNARASPAGERVYESTTGWLPLRLQRPTGASAG